MTFGEAPRVPPEKTHLLRLFHQFLVMTSSSYGNSCQTCRADFAGRETQRERNCGRGDTAPNPCSVGAGDPMHLATTAAYLDVGNAVAVALNMQRGGRVGCRCRLARGGRSRVSGANLRTRCRFRRGRLRRRECGKRARRWIPGVGRCHRLLKPSAQWHEGGCGNNLHGYFCFSLRMRSNTVTRRFRSSSLRIPGSGSVSPKPATMRICSGGTS